LKQFFKSGALVLAFVLLFLACQSTKEQQLFSDEKTARIMADLYIAEAAANGYTSYTKDSMMRVYYDQVFEIHGVTEADYEKNLRILAQKEQHIEEVVKQSIKLINPKAEVDKVAE
jgi:hypothetical protein